MGSSWSDVVKSNSFIMSGQKVWGQETSDSNYAIIYVPSLFSTHRWPMCMVTSNDGIHFDTASAIETGKARERRTRRDSLVERGVGPASTIRQQAPLKWLSLEQLQRPANFQRHLPAGRRGREEFGRKPQQGRSRRRLRRPKLRKKQFLAYGKLTSKRRRTEKMRR